MTKKNSAVVLLLRDALGNQRLQELLEAQTMCFEVFEPRYTQDTPIVAQQKIIVTSRHAALFCIERQIAKGATFFVVGHESADIIRSAKHGDVAYGADNVTGLLEQLKQHDKAADFAYIRGQHISLDIAKALKTHGMQVEEHRVYELAENASQVAQLIQYVSKPHGDMVVPLLSKKTAQQISAHIFSATHVHNRLHAVAISDAVMEEVGAYAWQSTHTAQQTDLLSLANTCEICLDGITQMDE